MQNLTLILASSFNSSIKDSQGNRHPTWLPDNNLYLSNIKKHTPKLDHVLCIANDPLDHEITDERCNILFKSLKQSGLVFKKQTILDSRNQNLATDLISTADLIFLCGGKLECQLDFFNQINLKTLLNNRITPTLIVGGSAGAMNLCTQSFNFPESSADLTSATTLLNGLGFYHGLIVPHFDGERKIYDYESDIDITSYILKQSHYTPLLAFNDDSYILIHKGIPTYHGVFYQIKDGKITRLKTHFPSV